MHETHHENCPFALRDLPALNHIRSTLLSPLALSHEPMSSTPPQAGFTLVCEAAEKSGSNQASSSGAGVTINHSKVESRSALKFRQHAPALSSGFECCTCEFH
jgi:hypothetical protein